MADQVEDASTDEGAAKGGIQALDAALHMLKVMATFPGAVSLGDLARRAHMPTTKTHRYLTSFARAGFVTQRERSGKYELGPESAKLGLSAIARMDLVNAAADQILQLAEKTGLTSLLTVWGTHGPTVIRWERTRSLTVTSLGLGSTLPLLTSANGRIFLAYLPRRLTEDMLNEELTFARDSGFKLDDVEPSLENVERILAGVRRTGLASVDGAFIPGLRAVAAPILNWQEDVEASIALIGAPTAMLSETSQIVELLKETAREISLKSPVGAS